MSTKFFRRFFTLLAIIAAAMGGFMALQVSESFIDGDTELALVGTMIFIVNVLTCTMLIMIARSCRD